MELGFTIHMHVLGTLGTQTGCENCISFKIRNSAHSFRSVKLHAVLQHIALCGGIKESFEAVFSFLIEFGEVKLMLISYKLD